MVTHLQKNWWFLTLRGILAVILGIIAAVYPGLILWTLLTFIGAIGLVSGIVLLLEGLSTKNIKERYLRITEGLINMIFALIILVHPSHSLDVTIFILAFWVIATGGFQVFWAIKFRKAMIKEWLGILNGILTLIFGFLMLSKLIEAAEVSIILIGIFYTTSGLLMILQSFRAKGPQII